VSCPSVKTARRAPKTTFARRKTSCASGHVQRHTRHGPTTYARQYLVRQRTNDMRAAKDFVRVRQRTMTYARQDLVRHGPTTCARRKTSFASGNVRRHTRAQDLVRHGPTTCARRKTSFAPGNVRRHACGERLRSRQATYDDIRRQDFVRVRQPTMTYARPRPRSATDQGHARGERLRSRPATYDDIRAPKTSFGNGRTTCARRETSFASDPAAETAPGGHSSLAIPKRLAQERCEIRIGRNG
jgi:hypothetical protein